MRHASGRKKKNNNNNNNNNDDDNDNNKNISCLVSKPRKFSCHRNKLQGFEKFFTSFDVIF